jgi:hypothetical protein
LKTHILAYRKNYGISIRKGATSTVLHRYTLMYSISGDVSVYSTATGQLALPPEESDRHTYMNIVFK